MAVTLNITVPVANPCGPRDTVTITGNVPSGVVAQFAQLELFCVGSVTDTQVSGGLLCWVGRVDQVGGTNRAPAAQFEVTASSIVGPDFSITLRPKNTYYWHHWPTSQCTWFARLETSSDGSATDDASRNVDTAAVAALYPDVTAPVVDAVTPANGGALGVSTPIVFTVTESPSAVTGDRVWIYHPDDGIVEMVWDGIGFSDPYQTNSIYGTPSGAVRTYTVRRNTPWKPGTVGITVLSYDATGNVGGSSFSYVVPGDITVSDPMRIRQNSADVRAGDSGHVFSALLRTFDRDVPSVTAKSLVVRYSVNGGATLETTGLIDTDYSPTGKVYFQLPDETFASPGIVRVELVLVDDITNDMVTYPVDDSIQIFVGSSLA